MKQSGKCITGPIRAIDSYTSDWDSVRIYPTVYYRRHSEFQSTLDTIKGLYVELDLGQYILIRFSNKDDLTEFHRKHHQHI